MGLPSSFYFPKQKIIFQKGVLVRGWMGLENLSKKARLKIRNFQTIFLKKIDKINEIYIGILGLFIYFF